MIMIACSHPAHLFKPKNPYLNVFPENERRRQATIAIILSINSSLSSC